MSDEDRQAWIVKVNKAIQDVRNKPTDLEAAKALIILAAEDEVVQFPRERRMFETDGATFQTLTAKSIGLVISDAVLKGRLKVAKLMDLMEEKV